MGLVPNFVGRSALAYCWKKKINPKCCLLIPKPVQNLIPQLLAAFPQSRIFWATKCHSFCTSYIRKNLTWKFCIIWADFALLGLKFRLSRILQNDVKLTKYFELFWIIEIGGWQLFEYLAKLLKELVYLSTKWYF